MWRSPEQSLAAGEDPSPQPGAPWQEMIEDRKRAPGDQASRSADCACAGAEGASGPSKAAGPSYEIRIRGRVEEWMISDFADMVATVEPADTVLFGEVRDQSALHGLLDRIQERGLELIEVRRLPAGTPPRSAEGAAEHR